MSYKLTVLTLLMCFAQTLYAQNSKSLSSDGNSLVYYVQGFDGESPLLPVIESFITRFQDEDGQKLFDRVLSLSNVQSNTSVESFIWKHYNDLNEKSVLTEGKVRAQLDSALSNVLTKFEKLLLIDISNFDGLLEYQFWLYNVKTDQNDIPRVDLFDYRSSDIIIDPRKDDYKSQIEFALKQIFTEANEKPSLSYLINDSIQSNSYVAFLGEEFEVRILIEDSDTEKSNIKLDWQLNGNSPRKYLVKEELDRKKFKFDSIGVYELCVKANDGIVDSNTEVLTLKVIDRLYLNQTDRNLFTNNDSLIRNYKKEIYSLTSLGWFFKKKLAPIKYPKLKFRLSSKYQDEINIGADLVYQNEQGQNQYFQSITQKSIGPLFEVQDSLWKGANFIANYVERKSKAALETDVINRDIEMVVFPRLNYSKNLRSIEVSTNQLGKSGENLKFSVKQEFLTRWTVRSFFVSSYYYQLAGFPDFYPDVISDMKIEILGVGVDYDLLRFGLVRRLDNSFTFNRSIKFGLSFGSLLVKEFFHFNDDEGIAIFGGNAGHFIMPSWAFKQKIGSIGELGVRFGFMFPLNDSNERLAPHLVSSNLTLTEYLEEYPYLDNQSLNWGNLLSFQYSSPKFLKMQLHVELNSFWGLFYAQEIWGIALSREIWKRAKAVNR